MNRRSMLAAVGTAVFGAGCTRLSSDQRNQDPSNTFETCTLKQVQLENLPEPARQEVGSALDNGGTYETTGPTYIDDVIDPERTVIEVDQERDPGPEDEHYEVTVTGGDPKRIELTASRPPAAAAPVLKSQFTSSTTVDLRIEGDYGMLVEMTVDSEDERFDGGLVLDQYDWRYGGHTVTTEFQGPSHRTGFILDGDHDDDDRLRISIGPDRVATSSGEETWSRVCDWDDDGTVDEERTMGSG